MVEQPAFEYFDWLKNGYPQMYVGSEWPKCNIVKYNVKCNEPENLIYLCKNVCCGTYHKVYEKDNILYAIYYMEANAVKNILETMKIEDIEKIKMYEKSTVNIVKHIVYELGSKSGSRAVPTLDNICNDSFTSPYYKHSEQEKIKCNKYLELLDVICQFVPHLVSEELFVSNNNAVINVLNNYYQKIDDDNKCFVCFGSYKNELIDSICECKTTKVHIGCLIKTVKNFGNTCLVCKKSYNARLDSRNRIFFPFSNLYWEPLMSKMMIIPMNDITQSLTYASYNLVMDRVAQILNKITDEEFLTFKNQYKKIPKSAKYYIQFKYDNDDYLMMTPYPASNMHCIKYPDEHNAINMMFKSRELQIDNYSK